MTAGLALCLLALLTSCAASRTVVRDPQLTEDCHMTRPADGPITYGGAVMLAVERGADLNECTARMRALRAP
jgi:hypothetical protein